MRLTNWLLVLPTLCLGAVIITSFVIFYAFRRGKQVIDQVQEENADGSLNPDSEMNADTRWARGELAENNPPETVIEMSACPGCGGENVVGSGACAYCGRKL